MKKIIAALFALTLCAAVFAACSPAKTLPDLTRADGEADTAAPTAPEVITAEDIATVSTNEELEAVSGRDILLPDGADNIFYFPAMPDDEGNKVSASATFDLNKYSFSLTVVHKENAPLSEDGDLGEGMTGGEKETVPGDVEATLFTYECDGVGKSYSAVFEADGCIYNLLANSMPLVPDDIETDDPAAGRVMEKEEFLEVLSVFTEQAAY